MCPRDDPPNDDVFKTSPEPGLSQWRQIADALRSDVETDILAAGARLPTETQLAVRFGVNRHTVRRALEELSRGGMLRIEQGRGTFVADDVLDYAVGARPRFSEWIRRHNREPSGRVLTLREMPAMADVAAGLAIPEGEPVVMFERIGLADGRPVSLATHYFPVARLPGILEALGREPGITAALASVGVPDYLRRSTRVLARLPSAFEVKCLSMGRGSPLLVCHNVNVDRGGVIVEYCVARYPTPRVEIVFEPEEAGSAESSGPAADDRDA